MSEDLTVTLLVKDLRVVQSMLQTMYRLLHEDQPECHGLMDLVLTKADGTEMNITKDVQTVYTWLADVLEDEGEDK